MTENADRQPGRHRVGRNAATEADARAARAPVGGGFLEPLTAHLGLDVCVAYRLSEDGSTLTLEPGSGVPDGMATEIAQHEFDATIEGAVLSRAARILVEDVQRAEDGRTARLRSLGLQAYVCHPLLVGPRLVGTLAFGIRQRPRFDPKELELLQAVSDQVALALDHERLADRLDSIERRWIDEERATILASERAARIEAEEANRARDEFLAVVSHKLRTPLNVMFGWVRMLQSPGLDAGQTAHALKVIERNIRAQTDLIGELLDVSRIVSGNLVLDMQPLDLLPIVADAVEAARIDAEAKGLLWETALGDSPLRSAADGARLRQAVSNVLSNAVKFTPAGGRITVRLERAGQRARLTVRDTGEGIAPDLLPHIFERYRTRDRRRHAAHGGLGVGLALARRLVELHGGSIAATSAGPRKGATFTLELPLDPPQESSAAMEVSEPVRGSGERLDLLRILVADDDADTRELLSVILKERGASVVTAESVVGAQRLLTGFRPDIVLCDISMPGEDGFRLLEWVRHREREQSRSIPVVALTAYARSEDRHRILSAGFKGYLPKPLDTSDIISVVRSLTGRVPRG